MVSNIKNCYFDKSKKAKGWGVFAAKDIKKGEIIEICPVILLPLKELGQIKKTKLYFYYFEYDEKNIAIFLGYGSLYNHSFSPNARYLFKPKNKTVEFKAIKNIKRNTEIMVNYN